jgi:GH24 family phage-related lysozyme (muramidase)
MNEKKNNVVYMIYYLLLFILTGTLINYNIKTEEHIKIKIKYVKVNQIVYVDTCNLFNEAINHLKEHEGFRSNVYLGNNGRKTIGYGHQLLKGESYKSISKEKAEDILVEDFNKHYERIQKSLELSDNQSIALALFSFNVGEGTFNVALKQGLLKNINKLSLYSYYKHRGLYRKSKKLHQRRLYELHLFKINYKHKTK